MSQFFFPLHTQAKGLLQYPQLKKISSLTVFIYKSVTLAFYNSQHIAWKQALHLGLLSF